MKKRILIVHPDTNMFVAIKDLLDEIRDDGGYEFSWSYARNQREAENKAGPLKSLDLVVTSLEISEDDKPSACAGEQRRRGLELVRGLRKARPGIAAAILITGQVDKEVVAFTQSEQDTGLVQEGPAFKKGLQSEITKHLSPHKPEKPRRVDLEISLAEKPEECRCRFHEGGTDLFRGLLTVNKDTLHDLVKYSGYLLRDVREGDDRWKSDLEMAGEDLEEMLFNDSPANMEFRDKFHELKGLYRGIENIRVRFDIQDKSLYPITVEALKRREEDPWMLQTAVYRCQAPSIERRVLEQRGLFQDEQPINFLIIQADVPYKAIASSEDGEVNVTLAPLPTVEEEVMAVEGLLSNFKKKGAPIGEVCVIKRETIPAGGSFKDEVERVLNKGAWQVLHYAGHTYLQNQVGYLFSRPATTNSSRSRLTTSHIFCGNRIRDLCSSVAAREDSKTLSITSRGRAFPRSWGFFGT